MIESVLLILLALVLLGVIYWVAAAILPHPFPVLLLAFAVVILLFAILGGDHVR